MFYPCNPVNCPVRPDTGEAVDWTRVAEVEQRRGAAGGWLGRLRSPWRSMARGLKQSLVTGRGLLTAGLQAVGVVWRGGATGDSRSKEGVVQESVGDNAMVETSVRLPLPAVDVEIAAVQSALEEGVEGTSRIEARDAEPESVDTDDGDPAVAEDGGAPTAVEDAGDNAVAEYDIDPVVGEYDGDPVVSDVDGDMPGDEMAAAGESEGGEDLGSAERLDSIVESLLLAAGAPLPVRRIVDVVGGPKSKEVREAVARLMERYSGSGCGIHLIEVAGGYQFRTAPANAKFVRTLLRQKPARLGRAALETLSIVAYKQPVTRGEVEAIRGVDADSAINTLLANKLIRIDGRKETVGRPLLYATTPEFLEVFGLKDLRELPTLKEIGPVPEPDYEADIEEDDIDTIDVEEAVAAAAAHVEERAAATRAGGEAGTVEGEERSAATGAGDAVGAVEVEGRQLPPTAGGELTTAAEGEGRTVGSSRGDGMVAEQIEEQAVAPSPGVDVAAAADGGLATGAWGNGVTQVATRPDEDDDPEEDELDDDEDDDLDEDDLDEGSEDDDFDFDDDDEDEDDEEEDD